MNKDLTAALFSKSGGQKTCMFIFPINYRENQAAAYDSLMYPNGATVGQTNVLHA